MMGAVSFGNLPIEAYPDVSDVRAEVITLSQAQEVLLTGNRSDCSATSLLQS